jgi:hypothetical protein
MNTDQEKSKSIRLAVIHWFPLEQFPPAQNILNFFSGFEEVAVLCCSTQRRGEQHHYRNPRITINQSLFPETTLNRLYRAFLLLWFPIWCFSRLIYFRPTHILYIEPHSAPAVFLYSSIFRNCRLFAHYHEYREPKHLRQRGNLIARIGYRLEKLSLFKKLEWISHTNRDRNRLFIADNPDISRSILHELPNLPPANWLLSANKSSIRKRTPIKLVYIGAVSLHDTYVEAFLRWLQRFNSGELTLDLFVSNTDEATRDFLRKNASPQLCVNFEGVPYQQLPTILPKYDIGLIFYRCNSLNYIYNAPNKLFEYITCGLSVLYPKQMEGVSPYARENCRPWVKPIDFDRLAELTINDLDTANLPPCPSLDTCEGIYQKLLDQILNKPS